MATVPRLHTYPLSRLHFHPELHRSYYLDPTSVSLLAGSRPYNRTRRRELSRRLCVSFKEEREDVELEVEKKETGGSQGNPVIKSLKSAILGISNWPSYSKEKRKSTLDELEELFSSIALQIGRYIVTMMSTGVVLAVGFQISGGDEQMNSLIWYSWLGGVIIGTMVGSNMVLDEYSRAGPRNVVITGSTRGLGKALAREFLLSGDRVIVTSRSVDSVEETVKELQQSLTELVTDDSKNLNHAKVVGIACDVCQPDDVKKLANFAMKELGSVDIWINNAGTNKGFRPLLQFTDEDIEQIVSTNLIGSILCTREAMHVIKNQDKGGHIFNMDGAGSGGSSTPLTAVYGSTKCGLRQLHASLLKECRRTKIGVHTASPGMVLTDLLLSGSSVKNKQMFNIICELPETVARSLVPRMRVVKVKVVFDLFRSHRQTPSSLGTKRFWACVRSQGQRTRSCELHPIQQCKFSNSEKEERIKFSNSEQGREDQSLN